MRCIVVEYGLPLARADIQPSVRAAELAERVAEAGGKNLRVVREPSVRGVAPGTPSAVDFFLLGEFLVDSWLNGFLWPASSQTKGLQDDQHSQARCRGLPSLYRRNN